MEDSMSDVRYELTLEGVSTLIMNNNTSLLTGGEDKGRDPAEYERLHFRDKAYRNEAGALVIPARCLKKCLMEACRFLPEKPKGVAFKSYGPFIQSATLVVNDAVLDKTVEDLFPLTVVVNLDPSKGNKGPRGPRTRPALV